MWLLQIDCIQVLWTTLLVSHSYAVNSKSCTLFISVRYFEQHMLRYEVEFNFVGTTGVVARAIIFNSLAATFV